MSGRRWYEAQLRIVQTVLTEPDAAGYDSAAVVAYLREARANCLVVNAGGIVDFFRGAEEPTTVNPFLGNRDILAELIREARRAGIRVMARVDFRGVTKAVYDRMPHWFARAADGGPKILLGDLYGPCFEGVYLNGHALGFVERLFSRYDFDGLWENALGVIAGPCYCDACRRRYCADRGEEIPVGGDYTGSAFDAYREWKAERADAHMAAMRKAVKAFGPDKAYASEIFGIFHVRNSIQSGIDLYGARLHADFLVSPGFLAVKNRDYHYDDLNYPFSLVRFLKALDPRRQAVLLFGGNGEKWRYVMDPPVELRTWLWEAASLGAGFWNCVFNGMHPNATADRRNAFIAREVYAYLEEHRELLEGLQPAAEIGIYYSKATRDRFGDDDPRKDGYGAFIRGAEAALLDDHRQYRFLPDVDLSAEALAGLKLLILPNAVCMSDEHLRLVREFVASGGGLVASFETSLRDERGRQRENFGLADLFGCRWLGLRADTSEDCYQKIRDRELFLDGLERTDLLMNDGATLLCGFDPGAGGSGGLERRTICSYVPRIPNQPPEKAWLPSMDTEYPTAVAGTYGAGRWVYFANQADRLCATNGHEDFFRIYTRALDWAAGASRMVETDADPCVRITLCRAEGGTWVLSLVNLAGLPRRPVRSAVPVFSVKARLSLDGALTGWRSLRGAEGAAVSSDAEGRVVVELPRLDEFASLEIGTSPAMKE